MNLDPKFVRQQIDNLKLQCPEAWDEGDDILLDNMLEAQTDTKEFLTVVVDRMQDASQMCGAIAGRIAQLQLRQARYEQREQAMRGLALKVMQAAGTKKLELSEATLSVRNGSERVEILDPASCPDDLCEVKRAPNKTKIKDALRGGAQLNWAVLTVGDPSLSVRTK